MLSPDLESSCFWNLIIWGKQFTNLRTLHTENYRGGISPPWEAPEIVSQCDVIRYFIYSFTRNRYYKSQKTLQPIKSVSICKQGARGRKVAEWAGVSVGHNEAPRWDRLPTSGRWCVTVAVWHRELSKPSCSLGSTKKMGSRCVAGLMCSRGIHLDLNTPGSTWHEYLCPELSTCIQSGWPTDLRLSLKLHQIG